MAGPFRAAGGLLASLLLLSCATGTGQYAFDAGPDEDPTRDASDPVTAVDGAVPAPDADVPPMPFPVGCLDADGASDPASLTLTSGPHRATASASGEGCAQSYELGTNQPLRASSRNDGRPRLPDNPRTVVERETAPNVRTHNTMFDALYALALEEMRENSVTTISDGAFDSVDCPEGGCFETGRDWTYVWTRDTAYSVDLALAALDPTRARNSLEFKLSALRSGGGTQIVQDTGTGGSYPVSSDRVVWALGASRLLGYLRGAERTAFLTRAHEAIVNTVEHDRKVVYDARDGLYRGEQSFLDWREQSYPAWTRDDVVHVGMSKSLSTNVAHAAILQIAAELSDELGDAEARDRYTGWASDLRERVARAFWLAEDGQFSSFLTTTLNPAPVRRFDALGVSLAVLWNVGDEAERETAVASYPHLPLGLPVLWPQQPDTPIYHNRAIWPFVSAYFLRAARAVSNHEAVSHGVQSLMRGAALNLSNMENLELASGLPFLADGTNSGPVVNSQRQLWSVAGYLSMVHDVLFGIEVSREGLRVRPFLPRDLRRTLFGSADSIVLNRFPFHGKTISIRVKLPPASEGEGAYEVADVAHNGRSIGAAFLAPGDLADENLVEVTLRDGASTRRGIRRMDDVSNGRAVFSPRTPVIRGVSEQAGKIALDLELGGAIAADVELSVLRDGQRIASGLSGSSTRYVDQSVDARGPTRCYALEACDVTTGTCSQHSAPNCYWGPNYQRITTVSAGALTRTGGQLSAGVITDFGDSGHVLSTSFTAQRTGTHLLQLSYANGAGNTTTGVTCGVKRFVVREGAREVGSGIVLLPHTNDWNQFRDSSFVAVELVQGVRYEIVLQSDDTTANMSRFEHFARYQGQGGRAGAFERVSIRELKVLSLAQDP